MEENTNTDRTGEHEADVAPVSPHRPTLRIERIGPTSHDMHIHVGGVKLKGVKWIVFEASADEQFPTVTLTLFPHVIEVDDGPVRLLLEAGAELVPSEHGSIPRGLVPPGVEAMDALRMAALYLALSPTRRLDVLLGVDLITAKEFEQAEVFKDKRHQLDSEAFTRALARGRVAQLREAIENTARCDGVDRFALLTQDEIHDASGYPPEGFRLDGA